MCDWLIYVLALVVLPGQHTFAAQVPNPSKDIIWERSSLKKLAPLTGSKSAGYARMIQLTNGSLLCVYESSGSVTCITSNDLGDTWSGPATIAAPVQGVNMAVPEILELKDHSLLVSYNPRPKNGNGDTTKRFAIRTKKSYDHGKTWRDERLVYQAGYRFEDGCWEPSQIQPASGRVLLFFSDEGAYKRSNEQNISLFTSDDNGLSWTKKPQIVSFSAGHRDGMPVPVILKGTGQVVFSIEDNTKGQFKPSLISYNPQKITGTNDKERTGAIKPALDDTVYAGAPYLRQLHSGETILSWQSTAGRSGKWDLSCMQVAIGDRNGKNFKIVSTPFEIPLNKYGLWNSLCVLNDDTIIALTSTNAFSDHSEVWMVKGRLTNKN